MLSLILALASACAPSPSALLDENAAATGPRPTSGTALARYDYEGQGLKGWVSTALDVATGRFRDEADTPPIGDLHGFDGKTAWLRDLSGMFVPQGRSGRYAIAVSEAYVNAQAWRQPNRGGAVVKLVGCDALQITPRGGNTFEARFDGTSHLLSSIRQTAAYGVSVERRYSNYRRYAGLLIPTRLEDFTNDDPSSVEVMRLTSFQVAKPLPASKFAMPSARPTDWSLPPGGRVTVPIRLLNNHVVLEARIDGKGPFNFMLDTGGHDILTPSTLAALHLASEGETPSGGGGEGMTTNGYARIESIDVGGARLTGQTVATLDFSPVTVEGIQLGGMLGLEFMEKFVVRVDYGARTLTIMDRERFAAERQSAGTAIPFQFYEHMPQIEGSFDGRPARYDIDTGSRSDVTLTSPFVERAHLRAAYPDGVQATEGWGVGGPTRAYLVRARTMTLGPIVVRGPVVGLSTAKKGALSDTFYEGNVGSGALKRFSVTFDYAHQTLYLKPARRLDADTSQFDRTGMWINWSPQGLVIAEVTKGGPAEVAGLAAGDVITAIAGAPVLGRELSDVRSSLKTVEPGLPLAIEYQRGGTTASARLVPRDLVPPPR